MKGFKALKTMLLMLLLGLGILLGTGLLMFNDMKRNQSLHNLKIRESLR